MSKTIFVTSTSSGFGRQTALLFAKARLECLQELGRAHRRKQLVRQLDTNLP